LARGYAPRDRDDPQQQEISTMTDQTTRRRPFAALALAATMFCGAGAASAATVQVTLDFGAGAGNIASPYVEDGFAVSGPNLFLFSAFGNPASSIALDELTNSLTITRVGGGLFSLTSFDYTCNNKCNFTVGNTAITSGPVDFLSFAKVSPGGLSDIAAAVFTRLSSIHKIDNIVLSYDDGVAPVPLPAGLPLLLAGLAGLGLLARRKGRAA
jgi:hypothetical protein